MRLREHQERHQPIRRKEVATTSNLKLSQVSSSDLVDDILGARVVACCSSMEFLSPLHAALMAGMHKAI